MPQISLPDIHLKEISERLQDARDDAHLPDELRERLSEAGDRISEAGGRFGDEVGDRLSDLRWSDLRLPALNLPGALRELSLPNIRTPKVDVPRVELPKNLSKSVRRELARLEVPQVTIGKPKSSGPPLVPFVILAGVAGVFVGWWLATSEFASGRIRSLLQQARVRMGLASEWDESLEERTEEFWSDERGWETGGRPDPGTTSTRERSATDESMVPSGSISGDGGPVGADDEEYATAGVAGVGSTSGWPTNPYGNPGGTIGGTSSEGSTDDSSGGTGYEPDSNR